MKAGILIFAFGLFVGGGFLGWILAPTPCDEVDMAGGEKTSHKVTKRLRSGGRLLGDSRMVAIRDSRNEKERMLAAIELAKTLPLKNAAQWLDEGLFSQREGCALVIFTTILKKRWRAEDPDGYLVWQLGHGESVSRKEMVRFAESNLDLLLASIRGIQDPDAQGQALANLAKARPDLVLAELANVDIASLKSVRSFRAIFKEMAKADLAVLQSTVENLPFNLREVAQKAIYGQLLSDDFPGTLIELMDQPDGLDILLGNFENVAEHRQLFLESFAGLPKTWQIRLERSAGFFTKGMGYDEIISTDWKSYGLPEKLAGQITGKSLFSKARRDREGALEMFQKANLDEAGRRYFLDMLSWNRGEGIIGTLMPHLEPADQDYISKRMGSRSESSFLKPWPTTAAELAVAQAKEGKNLSGRNISAMANWSAGQKAKFQEDYAKMQGEERHRVTAMLARSTELEQSFAAVNEILANPEAQEIAGWKVDNGGHVIPHLAIRLLREDSDRATKWVGELPEGQMRTLAMQNLARDWRNYDPVAAVAWVDSLPPAEREKVRLFLKNR